MQWPTFWIFSYNNCDAEIVISVLIVKTFQFNLLLAIFTFLLVKIVITSLESNIL